VLAETVSENDSAPPRYQAGLHDDIRKDSEERAFSRGWRNSRPTFMLLPTTHSIGLAKISGDVESIFVVPPNACNFSYAFQERCVNMLCKIWQDMAGTY
jgi:hypothetical protein